MTTRLNTTSPLLQLLLTVSSLPWWRHWLLLHGQAGSVSCSLDQSDKLYVVACTRPTTQQSSCYVNNVYLRASQHRRSTAGATLIISQSW